MARTTTGSEATGVREQIIRLEHGFSEVMSGNRFPSIIDRNSSVNHSVTGNGAMNGEGVLKADRLMAEDDVSKSLRTATLNNAYSVRCFRLSIFSPYRSSDFTALLYCWG